MPSIARVRAGHQAKNAGRTFEHLILSAASRDQMVTLRIPDGCETRRIRTAHGYKAELMRVRTPFDFVSFYQGRAIVFDAKSIERGRFTHSSLTPHQIHCLSLCSYHTVDSGHLIWFREPDIVAWIDIHKLKALRPRQSLGPEDATYRLGSGGSISLLPIFKPMSFPALD